MRFFLALLTTLLMASCWSDNNGQVDLTSQFKERWNINEDVIRNSDGTITYYSMAWGGLVAFFGNNDLPTDWSGFENVVIEFAEPTKVPTQVMINEQVVFWGNINISSMEIPLFDIDVTDVKLMALQSAEPSTFHIKRVYLANGDNSKIPTTIWEGKCVFGNWGAGVIVDGSNFANAVEGDELELVYTTDKSNSSVSYWQFRAIYNGTDTTLEGNFSEQNYWGCTTVIEGSNNHRMKLTAKDVANLKKYGLYINGYYMVLNQINLLQ